MRRQSGILALLLLLLIAGVLIYLYSSHKREVGSDLAAVQQKSVAWQQKSQDMGTTSKVKMAFELHKNLSQYPLDVSTNAGVVTLTGKVPADSAKTLAGQVAKDTQGVKDIVNNIIVQPTPEALARAEKEKTTDLEIKSAVLESFLKAPELKMDSFGINVEVSQKIVKLTGHVPTQEVKDRAATLARSIPGVREVQDADVLVTLPSSSTSTQVF